MVNNFNSISLKVELIRKLCSFSKIKLHVHKNLVIFYNIYMFDQIKTFSRTSKSNIFTNSKDPAIQVHNQWYIYSGNSPICPHVNLFICPVVQWYTFNSSDLEKMQEQQLIKSLYFGLLQVNFTGSFSLICKSIKYWLKEKQNHPFIQIYMIN